MFFNIQRSSSFHQKDKNHSEHFVKRESNTEQRVTKLRTDEVAPTGAENFVYLQTVWLNEPITSYVFLLKWCNKRAVFPNLEVMPKVNELQTTMESTC